MGYHGASILGSKVYRFTGSKVQRLRSGSEAIFPIESTGKQRKCRHPSFDSLHFLGVILTCAIKSLTPVPFPEATPVPSAGATGQAELTEYTEKNNKNSVISAGSAGEKKTCHK